MVKFVLPNQLSPAGGQSAPVAEEVPVQIYFSGKMGRFHGRFDGDGTKLHDLMEHFMSCSSKDRH